MIAEAESAACRLGIGTLRAQQREVLAHLARRTPTFAALPTGYGKSLCFWMPAVAWGWRVWVLSPLLSLIEDQALACAALGVSTVAWRGGLGRAERMLLRERMLSGDWQVCFLSPERFLSWTTNGFFEALAERGLDADLYALDEIHCLEEWREFRVGYRELVAPLRRRLARGAGLLGLSASLSARESDAWMRELCDGVPHARVCADLGRENLTLRVRAVETEAERWLELVAALKGVRAPESALVYCHSREEVDDLARWLRSLGMPAVAYHAGLPSEERVARSHAFRAGRLRLVCATSAFGMGIDYPHVSRVVHFSMPRDLESYWQEVGRAGRSGAPAEATAFWRRSEIARVRGLDDRARERFLALWNAWAKGDCRKAVVADRLGISQGRCGKCDRCERGISSCAWWTEPAACLEDWVRERGENANVERSQASSLAREKIRERRG